MFSEASLDLCKLATLGLRNRYKAKFTICGEAELSQFSDALIQLLMEGVS